MAQVSVIVPVYKAEKYISAAPDAISVCAYCYDSSELGILSRVSKNCGFSGGAALRYQCLGSGGIPRNIRLVKEKANTASLANI